MAGAGQQLLAGAGLALDQQWCIQRRHTPRFAHHGGHHLGALEDRIEAAQLLLAYVIDAFAHTIRAVQGQHRAGHGITLFMLGLQRRDIGEKYIALHFHPQAVDPRLVGAHQLGQIEILGITRQRNPRHLIHPHTEQLRGAAVGGNDGAAHIDGQHRKIQRTEQCIQLKMATLTGHQTDAFDPEHPGNRLELGPQRLELQVDQVRAVQIDGVALLATDFATGDVDAVFDQQVENVAKDANSVLAVDFDTHGRALVGLVMAANGEKSTKTADYSSRICDRLAQQQDDGSPHRRARNQFFTKYPHFPLAPHSTKGCITAEAGVFLNPIKQQSPSRRQR